MSKSVARHRKRRHEHALDRLRERYDSMASSEDVERIASAAKELVGQGAGVPHGFTDGLYLQVNDDRCGLVRVVYTKRHRAIATVLPPYPVMA